MGRFKGFPSGTGRLTPIPGPFFTQLLPQIDHLGELKVTLLAFWLLDHLEGRFRYLQWQDFQSAPDFVQALDPDPDQAAEALTDSLARAVARGTLLAVDIPVAGDPARLYFLNSPRGRAAVEAIRRGDWAPTGDDRAPIQVELKAPNVYELYEQHIGPLTPMIAESLQEAEQTYPATWIEEAVRIAVENNVRRWRYVQAILRSWQEEGRDERQTRGDSEQDRRRYVRGEFSEFIDH